MFTILHDENAVCLLCCSVSVLCVYCVVHYIFCMFTILHADCVMYLLCCLHIGLHLLLFV